MGDLDGEAVRNALLRKQYFPYVKAVGEELPALLSSESFSVDCAKDLAALPGKSNQAAAWTELRTRRFDGLVRRLGLPHPVPYSRLVLHIGDHWPGLAPLLASPRSQIKPRFHEDGRMVQMDYETSESTLSRETRLAQSQEFVVKADISNCFPSIYSHAIDWATRGKGIAKADKSLKSWQANLDLLVRNCHDRETKGVMIGPAVSNLLAELVLQRIDDYLVSRGHDFFRYVDDYTAYCSDRSVAERFVVDLQHALSEYRLDLNTRKTHITDLRAGVGNPWMEEVRVHVPAKITPLTAARFLRHSEMLAHRYPQYSVLKFAVKTLRGRREPGQLSSMLVVDELTRLCTFHPHLAPFLASELDTVAGEFGEVDKARISRVVEKQMLAAADRAETDVVLWNLHILRRVLKRRVNKPAWEPLLRMDDDLVALALMILCPRSRAATKKRVLGWDYLNDADYQQHWLVRYEMRRVGLITNADLSQQEKEWMTVMLGHNVVLSALEA
ncbi:RNA-directed DNA polymerase [Nocardioides dongxiaopingii]|uniref:RNA-directed DNA polymerase n=1 Tax=Nocardioides dongxiaopingii TaxID=2576036 RepID=UPI0010C76302|nr:RNA-directed DNA polymerase [Nocardioides dongxiaopingii]